MNEGVGMIRDILGNGREGYGMTDGCVPMRLQLDRAEGLDGRFESGTPSVL